MYISTLNISTFFVSNTILKPFILQIQQNISKQNISKFQAKLIATRIVVEQLLKYCKKNILLYNVYIRLYILL